MVDLYAAPDAWLGKFSFRPQEWVLGSDLSMLRKASGCEINGVIGMDFLARHIIQINFDTGVVSFLDCLPADPGQALPITPDRAGPCVPAYLPGRTTPEKFLVDTGSVFFGNLKPELLTTLASERKARIVGATNTVGLVGTEIKHKWQIESLTVAGFSCRDVVMAQTEDNLLGLGFLSSYLVTFDFPKGMMYLKKSSLPRTNHDLDMSGLHGCSWCSENSLLSRSLLFFHRFAKKRQRLVCKDL